MTTLVEKYEELKSLEIELEEAIQWMETSGEQLRVSINLQAAHEGRNTYPPYWLQSQLCDFYQQKIVGDIQLFLDQRLARLQQVETEFAQQATDALTLKTSAASDFRARLEGATGKEK